MHRSTLPHRLFHRFCPSITSLLPLACWLVVGGLLVVASAQAQPGAAAGQYDEAVLQRARELAQRHIVADTHIDVPYRIYDEWQDVTHSSSGDFDLPRASAGGLSLPFMSIYLPWQTEVDGTAYAVANRLIDQVEAIVHRAPQHFAIPHSAQQARDIIASGRIALAMGMENGAPIAGSLAHLEHFHSRGVRYITLAHSRANHIADSSFDPKRLWRGLSPFGMELVTAMNRIGMMVDVSHISDEAFWDVIKISRAPVIASHSSARHFTPGWERNIGDDMIKALAEHGGVVMVNFGSTFISQASNENYQAYAAARTAYMQQLGTDDTDDPRVTAFTAAYREKTPFEYATVSQVADHIDHIATLAGVDHVGLGSDFDGVGDSLPVGLKDVSMYPNLVAELLQRDYSDKDIEKILGGNLMRVWERVEDVAENWGE